MEKDFKFELNAEEKKYLKNLALLSISRGLNGKSPETNLEVPPYPVLSAPLGAFVTLKKNGQLRGCIGRLIGADPLYLTIAWMAQAAAFHDNRFTPLQAAELGEIELEISVMGPITPCSDPEKIEIGRHGLIMKLGSRQGLLLPQVPVEWNWNREEFLRHTCRKAGLPQDAWKDGTTEIFWFEAEVI